MSLVMSLRGRGAVGSAARTAAVLSRFGATASAQAHDEAHMCSTPGARIGSRAAAGASPAIPARYVLARSAQRQGSPTRAAFATLRRPMTGCA